MQLPTAVESYLFVKDLTPSSRRWYASKLDAFVTWCRENECSDTAQVNAHTVRRYLVSLRDTPSARYGRLVSSHTAHGHARVIKTWLRWLSREGEIDGAILARIDMPKRDHKVIQTFSDDDVKRLFAACKDDNHILTARDQAILAVLLDTGIRANELCTLTLQHTVMGLDDAYLLVDGKGRKQREVGLGVKSRQLLHRYIHRFRIARPGVTTTFTTRAGTPLHPEGLDRLLYRLRDRAGITGVRVSAHSFRHSYATRYLAQDGADVYKLSRLLGHTSVVVTEGYVRSFNKRDARRGHSVLDAF
jgi:site-specific recombinase XerD